MKLHTEKEFLLQDQHFALKLRNLFLNQKDLFMQMEDYLPYSIHINRRDNLDLEYANNKLLGSCQEIENLLVKGSSYLLEISNLHLLESGIKKQNKFSFDNDLEAVCSFPQQIRMNDKMTFLYSQKLILNENQYFGITNFVDEMGAMGKIFSTIFDNSKNKQIAWQHFQTLTKQEKVVLKLLSTGATNKEVGESLFISKHTVMTHRKNIYKKLDINRTSDLVRFSLALDLL